MISLYWENINNNNCIHFAPVGTRVQVIFASDEFVPEGAMGEFGTLIRPGLMAEDIDGKFHTLSVDHMATVELDNGITDAFWPEELLYLVKQ